MQSGTNFRPALLASFVLHPNYVCMDSPVNRWRVDCSLVPADALF